MPRAPAASTHRGVARLACLFVFFDLSFNTGSSHSTSRPFPSTSSQSLLAFSPPDAPTRAPPTQSQRRPRSPLPQSLSIACFAMPA
mmetsp:Transcript_9298/g.15504  ORF Transcript_9298/g.15504 Transcript_9298/m.15504 type:complete len:86 (-) Transcript_9298:176-433(-)